MSPVERCSQAFSPMFIALRLPECFSYHVIWTFITPNVYAITCSAQEITGSQIFSFFHCIHVDVLLLMLKSLSISSMAIKHEPCDHKLHKDLQMMSLSCIQSRRNEFFVKQSFSYVIISQDSCRRLVRNSFVLNCCITLLQPSV